MFILLALSFASCTSIKIELRKVNLADTTISLFKFTANNFYAPFRTLTSEDSYNFAETESQKTAARALEYMMQSRYEDAADTFAKAATEKDSLRSLWIKFPYYYYLNISYDWKN